MPSYLLVLVGCNLNGTKPSLKPNSDFKVDWAARHFYFCFINAKNYFQTQNDLFFNFQKNEIKLNFFAKLRIK